MYIFHNSNDLIHFLQKQKKDAKTIGFVPTMGALHDGHLQLVKEAKAKTDIVVCSIFVNPTQFNNPTDLEKYPRTIENDIALLATTYCDIVFIPTVAELYPDGLKADKYYELGLIASKLEGAFRPGHFQGVATVLDKFFRIVQADHLFMGQKDYQQCLVVAALIAQEQHTLQLHIVPTKRAADGLALSSRNARLSEGERLQAGLIYQCLISIQAQNGLKPFAIVQKECIDILTRKGIQPEYIYLCNAHTLDILEDYTTGTPMIVLIAAFVGEIRLIDNLVI